MWKAKDLGLLIWAMAAEILAAKASASYSDALHSTMALGRMEIPSPSSLSPASMDLASYYSKSLTAPMKSLTELVVSVIQASTSSRLIPPAYPKPSTTPSKTWRAISVESTYY